MDLSSKLQRKSISRFVLEKEEKKKKQEPVVTKADLIAAGDQLGCRDFKRAIIPETTGVDIDVPERSPNPFCSSGLSGLIAASMLTPGAAISGYRLKRDQIFNKVYSKTFNLLK